MRAGEPTTTAYGGTSSTTIVLHPTTEPRPTRTPGRITASNPTQTLSSSTIDRGSTNIGSLRAGSSATARITSCRKLIGSEPAFEGHVSVSTDPHASKQ